MDSGSKTSLATLLKAARRKNGLKLREVTAMTGISEGNLSRLETGVITSPRLNHVLKLAEVYGLNCGDFCPNVKVQDAETSSGSTRVLVQYTPVQMFGNQPLTELEVRALGRFLRLFRELTGTKKTKKKQ